MKKFSLKVTGMSCGHCELAVKNALEDLGAAHVSASYENNLVEFEIEESKLDAVKAEITELSYTVA
ncbi:MAG: cation transporter [Turicibacter sp.]|nr:cation transporter [Turicibacter sp.]